MNRSEEDYIKTIYELTINNNSNLIRNSDIAESLGYTDQSVNEMIKKLAAKGYVNFIPYKGVELTKEGKNEAVRMIRAHRVWEVFLMNNLNYSWRDVHAQAEFLEHAGNDELIERLYQYLGSPKYCGHGNPIPTKNGELSKVYTKSLYDFKVNQEFTLKRVLDNYELINLLDDKTLKINDTFIITEKDEFSGYIKVNSNNKEHIITNKIAKMLFGE